MILTLFCPVFAVYNEGSATPGANVWEINKLIIPVIREKVIYAYLLLSMNIQASDEETFKKMTHLRPLILDAIFADIYGAMGDLWIPNRDPKPETVQKRLQRVTDTIMAPGEAKIYIGTFYLQRLQQ